MYKLSVAEIQAGVIAQIAVIDGVEEDQIAGLQIGMGEFRISGIVSLFVSGVFQCDVDLLVAPVYETAAVEGIRAKGHP